MINYTDQLLNLHGYDYQVWDYSPVHSALTILATNKDKPNENVYLLFGEVIYVEIPMYWHGDFVLASDEEYVSIEEKSTISKSVAAYPLSNRRKLIELYKVERPNGNIYLLGNIASIKIEPKESFQ